MLENPRLFEKELRQKIPKIYMIIEGTEPIIVSNLGRGNLIGNELTINIRLDSLMR